MGNVMDLNPLSALAGTIKSISHDLSVYVFNAFESDCDCCSCWTFRFASQETHDETKPEAPNIGISWHT